MAASADRSLPEGMSRVVNLFRNRFRFGGARIGTRLTACFVAIVLSMMLADVMAIWQFSLTTAAAGRLNQADQTSLAVVRVHLDVDTFRDSVAALTRTHDVRQFTTEAASLRQKFVGDVAHSQELLESLPATRQDPSIRSALETLRMTLPSQLETTVQLASVGDWPAVSLRVANQTQALIDLSSSLVEKVDRQVSQERAQAIENAQGARRRLLIVLPTTALLTLLIAIMLGWYATQTITGPLSALDAGAQALARGEFEHQVAIEGEDELAHLGQVFNDTARRLAVLYATLRTNEARFRLTIDTIPGYVWSALPDGSVDFINRRWLEFSGISLEEGLGRGWEAAVHPDDLARFAEEWRAAVAGGKAMETEARVRRADGQYRWLLIRNVPLHDEEGGIVKWYGTSTDIDDRKRAEETLREQASLLNLTHDTIFVADLEGVIKYWNRGAQELYGWTAEQAMGRVVHDLLKTVLPAPLEQIKTELMHTGRWEGELVHTKKDGTQVVVASRWSLQRDEGGVPVAILETNNDISERKRAEETLRESETRFRTFVDHAADALFIQDFEQGTIVDVNRQACESLGYSRQELIGTTPLAFDRNVDRAVMESVAERTAAGETVFDMHWHERKDGTLFPVESHTSQFWYGGRRFLLKMARDITDRLRAEEERDRLRRLEADLAHVNRVTTMGELTASLAHELNQPITAVITSAKAGLRWLDRNPPELERARAAILRIENDGTRAAETISRVRAFYKKGVPPQPELLDVNEVAREMLDLLRSEATKFSIAMRTDLAAGLPKVRADRVQLQQVFMNLMLNGIEAMKETAGELTIKSQLSPEGEVLMSVSDTGVGLPGEKADQIFSAFFTTKEQGIGMGLAICRSIIESHGGRLWARANGRGATFHFTLPAEREVHA